MYRLIKIIPFSLLHILYLSLSNCFFKARSEDEDSHSIRRKSYIHINYPHINAELLLTNLFTLSLTYFLDPSHSSMILHPIHIFQSFGIMLLHTHRPDISGPCSLFILYFIPISGIIKVNEIDFSEKKPVSSTNVVENHAIKG